MKILRYFLWAAVATAAGVCLGGIALHRGEHINSLWLVLAAACSYAASTLSPLWYRIVIRMEIPAPSAGSHNPKFTLPEGWPGYKVAD